jgi:hypothetical protein
MSIRYRVVNLGGMLEDYQNEINNLKAKLNPGGYIQSGPVPMQPSPNPPGTTHQPPRPPRPFNPGATMPSPSAATGYPTEPPPPLPPLPPPSGPPLGGCPPGTTWTPSGCQVNVPSVDRYIPYDPEPSEQPPVPSVDTYLQDVRSPGQPQPSQPVSTPSAECPPGFTMTPAGCKPDVPTMDRYSRPGGFPGGLIPTGGLTPTGGMTASSSLFGLGAPHFSRPIRLRGR